MDAKDEIRKEVNDRDIKILWHFTRLENVDSILEYGLIPRNKLAAYQICPQINDHHRYDGHLNATNISISFPNYKLFYFYRVNDPCSSWVLIGLSIDLLWKKECIFCIDNAANQYIKNEYIKSKTGYYGFCRMFQDVEDWPRRTNLDIPPCYPTNPQAEVMVFDIIEPKFIAGLLLEDESIKKYLEKRIKGVKLISRPDYFGPRKDYKHWSSEFIG